MEINNDTKLCPFCGGTVLAVAKKCKHCGQWIDSVELEPCPVCSEMIPTNQKICPYCSEDVVRFREEALKPTNPCPICQEIIPVDVTICPYCHEGVVRSAPIKEEEKKKVSKRGKLPSIDKFAYIFIAIIIITVGFSIVSTCTDHESRLTETHTDEADISQVVYRWTDCHNERNLNEMTVLYDLSVKYYQSYYTREQVVNSKRKLLNKHKVFVQQVDHINVHFQSPDTAFVEFDKLVGTVPNSDVFDEYPSYLRLCKNNNEWLIIEESDYVTDANLEKRRNKAR